MTATSFTVASCAFLAVTFAAASVIDCPQKCIFQQPDDNTLTVDCRGGRQVNESVLSHQLDVLLSEDDLAEQLTTVKITNTLLQHVPMSVCRQSNLTSLNLDFNRLVRLPDDCFNGTRALQSLSARNNSITKLQDGLFDGLNSLRELQFNSNRIYSIGLRVFSDPNDLVNLRRVALDYNQLTSLEPWPYIRGLRGSAESKVEVTFYQNLISEFTNNIGWRFNCSRRSYADVMIGDNYIRHIGDIPAGWNITSLAEWTCVKHCKYKGSAFQVDFSWSHNYQCDCRDVPFYHSFFIDHSVFRFLPCRDPLPLRRKYVIQIPLEEFACDWPDGCPSGCRCAYRPANATFHVYCSAVNLPSLPLHVPPLPKSYDRCKLDFSKNKVLRRLEYRPYFVSTFLLDVSNCAIDVVDLNAWREFARLQSPFLTYAQVYLHGNDIVSVPLEVTGINFSSVQIALNQNPWECSCGNK